MSDSLPSSRTVNVTINQGIVSVQTVDILPDPEFGEAADCVYLRDTHQLSWVSQSGGQFRIEFTDPELYPFLGTGLGGEHPPYLDFGESKSGKSPSAGVLKQFASEHGANGSSILDLNNYWRLRIKYDVVGQNGERLDPVIVIDIPKTPS
jgi:hypothetical protein